MTPKEFEAVQKGYALNLADQRDQIIFGKQIPQQSVSVEPQTPLEDLFRQLVKRNKDNAKKLLNSENGSNDKLSAGQELFMKLLEEGRRGS